MPKKVLVILHPECEELELVAPLDVLRRGGLNVTLAFTGEETAVRCKTGLVIHGEVPLDKVSTDAFDAVLLPGGPGIRHLRGNAVIIELFKRTHQAGGFLACICAGPLLLLDAGLLDGHAYSAHPSTCTELPDAQSDQAVVIDRQLITSPGAGTAIHFGLSVLARLCGAQPAHTVAEAICFSGTYPTS